MTGIVELRARNCDPSQSRTAVSIVVVREWNRTRKENSLSYATGLHSRSGRVAERHRRFVLGGRDFRGGYHDGTASFISNQSQLRVGGQNLLE